MIALFIGAGAGIGPWLGGVNHDLNGDYFSAFSVAQVLTFSSVAFIWLAASHNERERGFVKYARLESAAKNFTRRRSGKIDGMPLQKGAKQWLEHQQIICYISRSRLR
jgi:hypothetical protein